MEDAHQDVLRENRMALARDLDVKVTTSYLYSERILSANDKEDIESERTRLGKNERLLDILPKRGPKAFDVFLKCLEAPEQTHLLKLLKPVPDERDGPIQASVPPPPPEGKPAATPVLNPQATTSFPDGQTTSTTGTQPDGSSRTSDMANNYERKGPIQDSAPPPPEGKPAATPVLNPQATISFPDGHTTSTIGTQLDGLSLTSDMANNYGATEGDGNKSSRSDPPSASYSVSKEDIYPMDNKPRGQAFIINNRIFQPAFGMEKLLPRNGTDFDAEELLGLFCYLGFETKVYHNQTSKEMFDIVKLYTTMDHSKYDCFMCAVLTHGEEGLIYSTDGKIPLKEFTSKFKINSLFGKPKLFFFQACQGSKYMDGVDQLDGAVKPGVDEVDAPGQNRITLPVEADFLYAYATVPGYYSWRNSVRGSWFGQAIVSVFKEHARTLDVMRMLTRVNAEVSKQKANTNDVLSDNKKQIPSVISQLRKELYFFPDNVVDDDQTLIGNHALE